MSRLAGDGTTESASWDQILRRQRGHGKHIFPRPADHPYGYTVDAQSAACDGQQLSFIHLAATTMDPPRKDDLRITRGCRYNSVRLHFNKQTENTLLGVQVTWSDVFSFSICYYCYTYRVAFSAAVCFNNQGENAQGYHQRTPGL